MKTTAYLLAVSIFAPVLLFLSSSVVPAASLIIAAGLTAIAVLDYGHDTEPSYAKVPLVSKPQTEHLPLAA